MTSPFAVGLVFLLAWVVFAVPVSIYLLKSWGLSKMRGFAWLFVAVVVWPAVARLLTLGINVAGISARMAWPMSTAIAFQVGLSVVETVIGGVLLLVAVAVLYGELKARLIVPEQGGYRAAAPPPAPIAPGP